MNYTLPAWFTFPKSAFWLRKDLTSNPFAFVDLRAGDTVMDCGAYVGTFAVAALEQGAELVCCYEPEPKNRQRLRDNIERYGDRAIIFDKGIAAVNGTATLSLSSFDGAHSIIKSGGKKSHSIATLALGEQLRTIRPQILKLDIEGAEYDALDTLSPDDLASVRSLFIEFHPIDERDRRLNAIRAMITSAGFNEVNTRRRAYTANRPEIQCLNGSRKSGAA